MEKERTFSLKITRKMWKQIKDVAYEDDKSMAGIIRESVTKYMESRKTEEK